VVGPEIYGDEGTARGYVPAYPSHREYSAIEAQGGN
jgi:hypothetical protein